MIWHIIETVESSWGWLRWVNCVLAMLVVILLVTGTVARWDHMPRRFRRIVPWVIATYVVIAYGSGEVATAEEPIDPGFRVFLMTLVLTGLAVSAMYRLGEPDYDESREA